MSVSEPRLVEVAGASDADDPIDALRDALTESLKALVASGCGPQHLVAMRWEAADALRFHPSRHEIELAHREVFAGFRAPVELRHVPAPQHRLRVVALAQAPVAPPIAEPVYRGYTLPDLARQYSPRFQTDMNVLFKQWSKDGARFRPGHAGLDLCYGPGRYETFDLFLPQGVERPPVWIFVHGGYWQASDKVQHVQFAKGMLDAGYAVVMANYGLAPETSLATIVQQVSQLLSYLADQAQNLSVDASRLHVAGHSAGAHIAAMIAAQGRAETLRSVLLLSGLFELEPLTLLPMGALLKLTETAVAELSPARMPAPAGIKLGLAVGAGESDEFKRQSQLMASVWGGPEPLIVPGHHFSMLEGLNGGALLELAKSLARG
jgi:arylformamidase